MTKLSLVLSLGAIVLVSSCSTGGRPARSSASLQDANDPYLWLEEIESERALGWVKERSDKTVHELSQDPRYAPIEKEVRQIVLAKDRIPFPSLRNGWIYNFWQDAKSVRGILRRVRADEYARPEPRWETILDLDELAKRENENWVWQGVNCLPPAGERCLLSLSRGGKDAVVVREFNLSTREFVQGGFFLPEAKSRISWVDQDTVFVGTDFGPGSLTDSGYPRLVKLWKRDTPLTDAKLLFEGKTSSMSVDGSTYFRPDGNLSIISHRPSFFEEENFIVQADGTLLKSPFPLESDFSEFFGQSLYVQLRKDWQVGARIYRSGSLLSLPLSHLKDPNFPSALEVIYEPSARSSLAAAWASKDSLYLVLLDNVRGRIDRLTPRGAKWERRSLPLPDHGNASIAAGNPFENDIYIRFESFLKPTTVYLYRHDRLTPVKSLPKRFDETGMVAEQFEASSKDGTKVPYFVIRKQSLKLDGSNPTVLYGYGGFQVSETPFYLNTIGKVWLERDGVYVLANIRGGGEFGPNWHQAALQEKRQLAFDDFIAIAEDLIRRKITSPKHLAIEGGSNGGLLVGSVFVQRPELFNGVVCQVPLLDMLRYHLLLAGSSWMAEYGNPDDPKMREAILKYSPYQYLRAEMKYPKVLITTSTKDDRVHPGHARKMVARMEEQGHPVMYYENIEGGHGGAANLEQRIKQNSMKYTYLLEQLAAH